MVQAARGVTGSGGGRWQVMRRLLALVLLLAATVMAVPAQAAPAVTVRGRVLDADGRAVAGAAVEFVLPAEDFGFFGPLVCLLLFWSPPCQDHRVTGRTGSDGRYALRVPLNSYVAEAGSHEVRITDTGGTATRPAAHLLAVTPFRRKNLTLPDLRLWRPSVSLDPGTPLVRRVHADPLPASYGKGDGNGVTVLLLQRSDVVGGWSRVERERVTDARTVEAGATGVDAVARATVGGLRVTYTSAAFPIEPGVRPVSRGRPCWTYGRNDALIPLRGCRFTDGKLSGWPDLDYLRPAWNACAGTTACKHREWLLVDLGSVQPVSALAVRGCHPDTFQTSLDGVTYRDLSGTTLAEPALYETPPTPARYVRIDARLCLSTLSELSVFAPL